MVTGRKVANLDLEVHEDLEQRSGGILRAIDNTSAARVPASRRAQSTITCERQMVADSPEDHLRSHALVDSVQQFLDKAGSGFGRRHVERAPTVKLPLGRAQPPPAAFGISENLFGKRGNTSEAYRAVFLFISMEKLSSAPGRNVRAAR